jgi:hypothetical protein
MSETETVEQAAAAAGRRWRFVAIGLALVFGTDVVNAALNTAQLTRTPPLICIAAINDPKLAEQAVEQRIDQQGGSLRAPKR